MVALGCEIFAFVDALRHPENAYVAAGKRTKRFWLLILGVALALGVISSSTRSASSVWLGFVAAAVYLADVRPALRQVRGSAAAPATGGEPPRTARAHARVGTLGTHRPMGEP